MEPSKFKKNNLADSISPYLFLHKDNPVWWQPWNLDTLAYARKDDKIIFASIGYSTCHWCHVMAEEAFSDKETADYLNKYFVSIKVDREERPDIDRYSMAFIFSIGIQGGWPLNIFFTPNLNPIYALTYAPSQTRHQMASLLDILKKVKTFYDEQKKFIEPFNMARAKPYIIEKGDIIDILWSNFDHEFAGFKDTAKFPPHSTLLFMLYYFEINRDNKLQDMITRTLDAMRLGGYMTILPGDFFVIQ